MQDAWPMMPEGQSTVGHDDTVDLDRRVLAVTDHASSMSATSVIKIMYERARGDSLIALGVHREKEGEDEEGHPAYLAPIPVDERNRWIPDLWRWYVDKTLYVAPNTLNVGCLVRLKDKSDYRLAVEGHIEGAYRRDPHYFAVQDRHARELGAVILDLDVGRGRNDLTSEQAVAVAVYKGLTGVIPQPSLYAHSGRGAYLLYLLRDTESEYLPLATPDNVQKWRICTGELVQRCADLKADPRMSNLLRWIKAPETVDHKTGRRVTYLTVGVSHPGNVPVYSLPDMVRTLGLYAPDLDPTAAIESATRHALPPATRIRHRPTRQRNVKPGKGGEPYRRRADEILALANHRRGIKDGHRHHALLYYHTSLLTWYRRLYESTERAYHLARQRTEELNATLCKPPLPPGDVRKCCPTKRYKLRDRTIVTTLQITRDEYTSLSFEALVPDKVKATRRAREEAKREKNRQRRAGIRADLTKGKLSVAQIAAKYHVTRQAVYHHRKKIKRLSRPRQKTLPL